MCTKPNFKGEKVIYLPGDHEVLQKPIYKNLGSLRVTDNDNNPNGEEINVQEFNSIDRLWAYLKITDATNSKNSQASLVQTGMIILSLCEKCPNSYQILINQYRLSVNSFGIMKN